MAWVMANERVWSISTARNLFSTQAMLLGGAPVLGSLHSVAHGSSCFWAWCNTSEKMTESWAIPQILLRDNPLTWASSLKRSEDLIFEASGFFFRIGPGNSHPRVIARGPRLEAGAWPRMFRRKWTWHRCHRIPWKCLWTAFFSPLRSSETTRFMPQSLRRLKSRSMSSQGAPFSLSRRGSPRTSRCFSSETTLSSFLT